MRVPLVILLLALLAACTPTPPPAPRPTAIWDVVESYPDDLIGEWTIGGRAFTTTSATEFGLMYPVQVGHVSRVTFIDIEGVATATHIEPFGFDIGALSDGPHVLWHDARTVEVITVENGQVLRQHLGDITVPTTVDTRSQLIPRVVIDPEPPRAPQARWPLPSRLLAISDVEGNYGSLLQFLMANGVIDRELRWSWGDGHLLFNGDIVDRGDHVTETLWFIRRLEREAAAAGGRVHFVLGNHEAMIMAGDLRYVHPKYRFLCRRLGIMYSALYGPASEMGRWLRSRNSLVEIGPFIFVHGGYSPALDALDVDADAVNVAIRMALGVRPRGEDYTLGANLAWNSDGPLWYRGYFADPMSRPTSDEIDSILARYNARAIVVGHSVVSDVCWLEEQQRLIGIDVEWRIPGEGEGLLIENGQTWRVNSAGARQELDVRTPPDHYTEVEPSAS